MPKQEKKKTTKNYFLLQIKVKNKIRKYVTLLNRLSYYEMTVKEKVQMPGRETRR